EQIGVEVRVGICAAANRGVRWRSERRGAASQCPYAQQRRSKPGGNFEHARPRCNRAPGLNRWRQADELLRNPTGEGESARAARAQLRIKEFGIKNSRSRCHAV